MSSLTVWLETVLMLPTLSSTIQRTSVLPRVVMLKVAPAPATAVPLVTASLPSMVGAVPSVV